METTRKENEFVLTSRDIIYSVQFWAILFFAAFVSARMGQNYFMASLFCFAYAKYFGNDDVIFCRNKLSKFVLRRYPYTTKMLLALVVTVTIMLSWFSFKAFICSIILSAVWKKYMNAFTKRKSLI